MDDCNNNAAITKVRKSYTAAYKLKVVELALEIGVTKAARVFSICHSMVSRWVKNVSKFKVSKPQCRKIGSGRTPAHPELETQLHSDIIIDRQCGIPVSLSNVKNRMLALVKDSFKALMGLGIWIY